MVGIWVSKLGVRIVALGAWMEYPTKGYAFTLHEVQTTISVGATFLLQAAEAMALERIKAFESVKETADGSLKGNA
jgi:hypothetical protein